MLQLTIFDMQVLEIPVCVLEKPYQIYKNLYHIDQK